jgi:hypothetical protein
MKSISIEYLQYLLSKYPKGTWVELLHMEDPYPVPAGTKGHVTGVDDICTIHVQWDNGSTLGAVSEDEFRVIKDNKSDR